MTDKKSEKPTYDPDDIEPITIPCRPIPPGTVIVPNRPLPKGYFGWLPNEEEPGLSAPDPEDI